MDNSATFPFFSFDYTTILGTICNTLILFLVIKHFLFDKINALLESRNAEVAATYAEADDALKSASEKEKEYTERLSGAKAEAAQIVTDATKKAQSRSDQIISDAKNDARDTREKAITDIEREKKQTVNAIKNDISEMAVSIASKVVSKEIDPTVHAALIDECIAELDEAV
jgi:F-type H+-transporting ATPase subunit b